MSANRKRKLRERAERMRQLAEQRNVSFTIVPRNIPKEAEYITSRALERDARCVVQTPLVFFSTQSGDAWMLDLEDGYAICLARDGVRQAAQIADTGAQFAVEWDHDFSIVGDVFTTTEKKSGRVTRFLDYPIEAILATIQQHRDAQQ